MGRRVMCRAASGSVLFRNCIHYSARGLSIVKQSRSNCVTMTPLYKSSWFIFSTTSHSCLVCQIGALHSKIMSYFHLTVSSIVFITHHHLAFISLSSPYCPRIMCSSHLIHFLKSHLHSSHTDSRLHRKIGSNHCVKVSKIVSISVELGLCLILEPKSNVSSNKGAKFSKSLIKKSGVSILGFSSAFISMVLIPDQNLLLA